MGQHLGKALRELRRELGLSQSEVARRAKGVSRATVVVMERGDSVRLGTVEVIASSMGASRKQVAALMLAWFRDCVGEEWWREVVGSLRR